MDHITDDNEKRYTVTVFNEQHGTEVFNSCIDVEPDDQHLLFLDKNGKSHEFFGVHYHIAQE